MDPEDGHHTFHEAARGSHTHASSEPLRLPLPGYLQPHRKSSAVTREAITGQKNGPPATAVGAITPCPVMMPEEGLEPPTRGL